MLYNNQEYYYPGMPQPAMPTMALNRKCYIFKNFPQLEQIYNLKAVAFFCSKCYVSECQKFNISTESFSN